MIKLYSCGSNAFGQLGNGTVDDSHKFTPCHFEISDERRISRIVDVALGANHTLLLLDVCDTRDDTLYRELWGTGDRRAGQLGPERSEESSKVFRKVHLDVQAAGRSEWSFKFVAATWETSYVVLSQKGGSDVVISFGSDDFGDLGVGDSKMRQSMDSAPAFHMIELQGLFKLSDPDCPPLVIIDCISVGQRHVVLHVSVTRDNHDQSCQFVVGWGSSRHGQLGTLRAPTQTYISSPTIISFSAADNVPTSSALGIHHSVYRTRSGKVLGMGSNRKRQLEGVDQLDNVHTVGATWNATYAIRTGESGQEIFATGSDNHGQLGRDNFKIASNAMAPISLPFSIDENTPLSLACGTEHVLVNLNSSEVWGWGWNEHGNLGVGHTLDVLLPAKIWPPTGPIKQSRILGVWAGSGTSWICVAEFP